MRTFIWWSSCIFKLTELYKRPSLLPRSVRCVLFPWLTSWIIQKKITAAGDKKSTIKYAQALEEIRKIVKVTWRERRDLKWIKLRGRWQAYWENIRLVQQKSSWRAIPEQMALNLYRVRRPILLPLDRILTLSTPPMFTYSRPTLIEPACLWTHTVHLEDRLFYVF